jgi:voltage-gated potassium channel
MWWTIVTITTVGYGDVVPITVAGKILAVILIFIGLASIAIMTAVLTKVFIDHFFGKRLHHCEMCHFPHHDHDAKFCKNCGNQLDTEKLAEAEFSHPHNVHQVCEK